MLATFGEVLICAQAPLTIPDWMCCEQIFKDSAHTPVDYVVDEKLRNPGSPEKAKSILVKK